jgi:hypothetical protein
MASAKASLLTYRSKFTFDGVEYGPLMYKVIMHLATIDSVATTQTKPDDCYLGKQHKDEQKKKPHKANSATVAAAATLAVTPLFAALMAAMANLDMNE